MTTPTDRLQRTFVAVLLAAITTAGGARLVFVFRQNINWDEFYFLSQVHDHLRGTLSLPFQTIHVHFFQWIPFVAENEVDQIIVARIIYFGLGAATSGIVYAIGRRYFGVAASLFIVLCYLAYREVLIHGSSFRTDGFASFLFVAASYLLLRSPSSRGALMTSGVLTASMLLVTVKSVFYLPTLLAILSLDRKSCSTRTVVRRCAVWGASTIAAFGLFFACHRAGLASGSARSVWRFTEDSWARFLLHTSYFPRLSTFLDSLNDNVMIWLSITVGTILLGRQLRNGSNAANRSVLLWFLSPLASLLVYRNAFPYFYVFLMPSAVILAGPVFQGLIDAGRGRWPRAAPVITLIAVLGVSASLIRESFC